MKTRLGLLLCTSFLIGLAGRAEAQLATSASVKVGTTTGTAGDGGVLFTTTSTANAAIPSSRIGAANGVASLNSSAQIPSGQILFGTTTGTVADGGVLFATTNTANTAVQQSGGNASATVVTASGSTAARTLANRTAERINILDYAPAGSSVDQTGATDVSGALAAAINVENARMAIGLFPCLYIPAGNYLIGTGTAIPAFAQGKAGCVVGDGPDHSNLTLSASYAGDLFTWSESWIAGSNTSGATVIGIRINGAPGAASQQNALVFYDRDDNVVLQNVDVWNMPGRALYSGVEKNTSQAYMRESRMDNLRFFADGAAGVPVVEFTTQGGTGTDGTNEIRVHNLDIFGNNGPGLLLHNVSPGTMRGLTFDNLRIEGTQNNTNSVAADLLTIGDPNATGNVVNVAFHGLELIDPYGGYAALRMTGSSASTAPYGIDVEGVIGGGLMQAGAIGIEIDAGRLSNFKMSSIATTGTNVVIGSPTLTAGGLKFDGLGAETSWTYNIASGSAGNVERGLLVVGNPTSTATDIQSYRNSNTAYATGTNSFAAGSSNTVTSLGGVALGDTNSVSGSTYSAAVGQGNTISGGGSSAFALGQGNRVSAGTAAAIGYSNTVSGSSADAIGYLNTADGTVCAILGGQAGVCRGRYAFNGFSGGNISTVGDAQEGFQLLHNTGSGTTPIRVTANGGAANSANCVNIPNNFSYHLRIALTARDFTTPGQEYHWDLPIGALSRNANCPGGTGICTALGTPSIVSIGTVTGAGVIASADATNYCLNLSFTPPSANTTDVWHVVAKVDSPVEVQ